MITFPSRSSALRLGCATRRWSSSISLAQLSRKVQSYVSTSRDPYINLSIEHHLLQKSEPESCVLFLYINRPSIIIGRNQNPWLEVNLALLNSPLEQTNSAISSLGAVDLVRRRSGGGTVFHDEGNVNWTVISSSAGFTRDKHAEMVVRGLRACGIDRARVNERHDIVLDQGDRKAEAKVRPDDTHVTAYQEANIDMGPRPLKVSGSAYKLIRNRALHHGTCLLNSPNLSVIPQYLHPPARPFITARGVESVSSPVGNIGLSNDDFIEVLQQQFGQQYQASSGLKAIELSEECIDEVNIRKGVEELKSKEWTFLQTPQFVISSKSAIELEHNLELTIRYGKVNGGSIYRRVPSKSERDRVFTIDQAALGQPLHKIDSWDNFLGACFPGKSLSNSALPLWLGQMVPKA